jgi:hypothetical protein
MCSLHMSSPPTNLNRAQGSVVRLASVESVVTVRSLQGWAGSNVEKRRCPRFAEIFVGSGNDLSKRATDGKVSDSPERREVMISAERHVKARDG